MDETTELTQPGLQQAESALLGERHRLLFSGAVRAILAAGWSVEAAGGAALEGLMRLSGFERGLLFALPLPGESVESNELNRLSVLASRCREDADAEAWSSIVKPKFAMNRSVVSRVLTTRRRIGLNDSLLHSESGEAQQRAVVCDTFEIRPGLLGLYYLDRGGSGGDFSNDDLERVTEAALVFTPLVSRVYLAHECTTAVSAPSSAEDDGEASSPGNGEWEAPEIGPDDGYYGVFGRDENLQKIFAIIEKIKNSDLNVCIIGESGTGKELLARAIHQAGNRRDEMFVAENCGSIPENLLESELFGHVKGAFTGADEDRQGLFETADRGVLFLDEIGDMSEGMQRKLLRVLEERTVRPIGGKKTISVDVRVVCASNRDLKQLVRKKVFRADLYYRLNVVSLELPPLRERLGDLPMLVKLFLSQISEEEGVSKRFSTSALRAFLEYSWPGNLREMRNVLRRVLLTASGRIVARKDVLGLLTPVGTASFIGEDLERDENQIVLRLPARQSFQAIIQECERIVLLNALRECAWNKSKVTQVLKIPRQSLYNKIAKYDLRRDWPETTDA